jgi:hypothetical protein
LAATNRVLVAAESNTKNVAASRKSLSKNWGMPRCWGFFVWAKAGGRRQSPQRACPARPTRVRQKRHATQVGRRGPTPFWRKRGSPLIFGQALRENQPAELQSRSVSPLGSWNFPGLNEGDRDAFRVPRWKQSLEATHSYVLEFVRLEELPAHTLSSPYDSYFWIGLVKNVAPYAEEHRSVTGGRQG